MLVDPLSSLTKHGSTLIPIPNISGKHQTVKLKENSKLAEGKDLSFFIVVARRTFWKAVILFFMYVPYSS